MSEVRGIAEIVLIVDDVVKAADFYRDVVGLEVDEPPADSWAWFIAGDEGAKQRIALRNGSLLFEEHSPLPPGERWGRVHFALYVPPEDLDNATRRVRENGIEVYGPTHFEWMDATSYYFYDTEGNLVEFWSPEHDDKEDKEEEGSS